MSKSSAQFVHSLSLDCVFIWVDFVRLMEVTGSKSISLHYNEVLLFLGALSSGLVLFLWWMELASGLHVVLLGSFLPSTLDSGPASHKA